MHSPNTKGTLCCCPGDHIQAGRGLRSVFFYPFIMFMHSCCATYAGAAAAEAALVGYCAHQVPHVDCSALACKWRRPCA